MSQSLANYVIESTNCESRIYSVSKEGRKVLTLYSSSEYCNRLAIFLLGGGVAPDLMWIFLYYISCLIKFLKN